MIVRAVGVAPLLVAALLASGAQARAGDLALRGFVRDAKSRSAVRGASVSVSGAQSRSDQITDDQGFFRLSLPAVAPGGLARVRVQKDGYAVFDRNVGATEEIPLDVELEPLDPVAPPRPSRPSTPSEIRLLLAQLKSPDPASRIAAVEAFASRTGADSAALNAILLALDDKDGHVRSAGLAAVRQSRTRSPRVVARVAHLLHDPDPMIVQDAASTLGLLGPPAVKAVPELMFTLQQDWSRSIEVRRSLVETLLRLGQHRDQRLAPALVETVVALGTSWRGGDVRGNRVIWEAFQEHPDLVASQIPALVVRLAASSEVMNNANERRALVSLLWFSGPPGRKSLAGYASTLQGENRARFALLWIGVAPEARPDVLAVFSEDELARAMVPWLDGRPVPDDPSDRWWPQCGNMGATVNWAGGRAWVDGYAALPAMTASVLLTLNIGPREHAMAVLAKLLRSYPPYAQFTLDVLPSLPPGNRRLGLAAVVATLGECTPKATHGVCRDEEARPGLIARLAELGDAATIEALSSLAERADIRTDVRQVARNAIAAIRVRVSAEATALQVRE